MNQIEKFAALVILANLVTIFTILSAREGFQDKKGFHFGRTRRP